MYRSPSIHVSASPSLVVFQPTEQVHPRLMVDLVGPSKPIEANTGVSNLFPADATLSFMMFEIQATADDMRGLLSDIKTAPNAESRSVEFESRFVTLKTRAAMQLMACKIRTGPGFQYEAMRLGLEQAKKTIRGALDALLAANGARD